MTKASTALTILPTELRIQKRSVRQFKGAIATWLPVVLLAPFAFMVEVPVAAIGILAVVGLTIGELRRSTTQLMPSLELADSGNIEEATFEVAQMAKKEKDWRRKSFLIGILAHLELRAGNQQSALALARESVRYPQPKQPLLERSLEANLAMILMILGHEEEAMQHLPKQPIPDPITDSSRLVIWARAGRYEEVVQYTYRRMPQIQGMRHNSRVLALMKAFSIHQCNAGALKLQRYLDDSRPRVKKEYEYLSEDWQELADFIASHKSLTKLRTPLERA